MTTTRLVLIYPYDCTACEKLHTAWNRSGHHLAETITMLIRRECRRNCR